MIVIRDDGIIELHTRRTSYILCTAREGLVENLHYGPRIQVGDGEALRAKVSAGWGGDVLRREGQAALSSLRLELSPAQRGDYRAGALLADMPHGGRTSDFGFVAATVLADGKTAPKGGLPGAYGADETLCLALADPSGVAVELYYSLFVEADVITRRVRVANRSGAAMALLRCHSMQLDLPRSDWRLFSLAGAWAREAQLTEHVLAPGTIKIGSGTGASSNRHNPFFFLAEPGADEFAGGVYGFNLVYSGSHEATVEVDTHGRTRVMNGIWSEGLHWPLAAGEDFVSPEAVLTYSEQGKNGMSHNMHAFVKNHILPPRWAAAPRPVLVNNWEGTYFNFTELKLLKMARIAAGLGVELFVLDDGWFGERNSDRSGLGDYAVNTKKLPGGLARLAKEVNALGMGFGLWFEPEMVSVDSDLYRAHPNWIVRTPGYDPALGRHQYVLDLCREEVRDYIVQNVNKTLDSANIQYVKWDMNRHVSDNYSPALAHQGMFHHAFALGLYQVLEGIVAAHPKVLFEGCSSGGNRFDLGILCYMPQIWTSDDSDAHERQRIQTGVSYGYPPCTMGCHVSAVPNHQTLRHTPLDTRFNTAAFGLLGYELDMRHLTRQEREDVKEQISFYKKHRKLLQYGDFWRLQSPFETDRCRWIVVSPDKAAAIAGDFTNLLVPNSAQPPMKLAGLEEEALYRLWVRGQKISIESFGGLINYILPLHLNPEGGLVKTAGKLYRLDSEKETYAATGGLLCKVGLTRKQEFSGAGYSDEIRFLSDFASRLYLLERL